MTLISSKEECEVNLSACLDKSNIEFGAHLLQKVHLNMIFAVQNVLHDDFYPKRRVMLHSLKRVLSGLGWHH